MAYLNTFDEVALLIVTAELANMTFDNDPDKVFYAKKRYDEIRFNNECKLALGNAIQLMKRTK